MNARTVRDALRVGDPRWAADQRSPRLSLRRPAVGDRAGPTIDLGDSVARRRRLVAFAISLPILAIALLFFAARWQSFAATDAIGIDYRTLVAHGQRWLDGGSWYQPYQLAGPYVAAPAAPRPIEAVPVLYPPVLLPVTVALTATPAFLWWVIPLAVIAYAVISWRPAPWSWPLLSLIACWPWTQSILIVGGTSLWIAAFVAAGLRWRWPAVFVCLKPSLLPFVVIGMRDIRWWIAAGVLILGSMPLAGDYVRSVQNATGILVTYSAGDIPIILVPVIAWLARTRIPVGRDRWALWGGDEHSPAAT